MISQGNFKLNQFSGFDDDTAHGIQKGGLRFGCLGRFELAGPSQRGLEFWLLRSREFTLASDRSCLVVTEGRYRFFTDRAGPP